MRAVRLPYPLPEPAPRLGPGATHMSAQWELMRSAGMLIDFPERKVSYALFCFNQSDVPRYTAELRKAVELQVPGAEPPHLEIRAATNR